MSTYQQKFDRNLANNLAQNISANTVAKIFAKFCVKFCEMFGGISATIPAEWVAGSAEWVAGSAVKLGIFSDFWRGAGRPRQKSKNRLNNNRLNLIKVLAEFRPKFPSKIRPEFPPNFRQTARKTYNMYLAQRLQFTSAD